MWMSLRTTKIISSIKSFLSLCSSSLVLQGKQLHESSSCCSLSVLFTESLGWQCPGLFLHSSSRRRISTAEETESQVPKLHQNDRNAKHMRRALTTHFLSYCLRPSQSFFLIYIYIFYVSTDSTPFFHNHFKRPESFSVQPIRQRMERRMLHLLLCA